MNRYIKFYLIAAAFLVLPYYMAFTNDMLGTGIFIAPAFLLFFISFIYSLILTFYKEDRKYHLIKTISNLILISSLIIPLHLSNRGLGELTEKRIHIIKELKPIFLKYRTERGYYPKTLTDLVPGYIKVIPNELMNDGIEDPYKIISYVLEKDQPIFYFKTHRGPDSSASLNVVDGTFWHDE